MKRKRPVQPAVKQAPVRPKESAVPVVSGEGVWSIKDTVSVCLYSLLLFLSMTVQTGRMSVVLAGLAVLCVVGRAPLRRMGETLSVPVLGFLVFILMAGLAAIYSAFDTYAVREYYKYIAGFSMGAILLLRFGRKHVRGLLWGLAAVCAGISLMCIDAGCHGGLFSVFNSFVELLGGSFSTIEQSVDAARINGIYNDANVSASILGIGALASLYLLHTEENRRRLAAVSVLLGVNAMGFFLSLSRGAILCFALALLAWLVAAPKETRLKLFCQMLFTALVTLALSFPAMAAVGTDSWVPNLMALLCGVGVFALEMGLTARFSRLLAGHRRAAYGAVGVVGAACLVYAVAALLITGSAQIGQAGYLNRSARLDAGEYTLSGEWEELSHVNVLWRNRTGALMDTWDELYQGSAGEAAFTVPEDNGLVLVQFWGDEGTEIHSAAFSDGTELTLNRPLLPAFVNERLQDDLFMSFSFLVRVQYMKDAWTLFTQSPLTGHGLGSTEGLYTSVQPFFYESLFVHNHILQAMSDMGLLGLAGFLGLLLGGLWLLLRRLRQGRDPLAAVLLACWVMINAHGLMEINFSIRAYLCLALPVLLLPVLLYAKPLLNGKAAKWGGFAVAGALALYFAVFGGLLLSHRMVENDLEEISTDSVSEFMDELKSYVRRDVFVQEDYKLTFVANAVARENPLYNKEMWQYAEDLRQAGTYTACSGLARYYYLPRGEWEELFACSREGIAQEASTVESWNLQIDFYRTEVLPAMGAENVGTFLEGVRETAAYLEAYSEGRMEEIVLTEENQAFLTTVETAWNEGAFSEEAYEGLLAYAEGGNGAAG